MAGWSWLCIALGLALAIGFVSATEEQLQQGPARPQGKRISMAGARCVSQCAVRPHSLQYMTSPDFETHYHPRFGTPEDLLHGLNAFATCIVDPSLSSSFGGTGSLEDASRNQHFHFQTKSSTHRHFSRRSVTAQAQQNQQQRAQSSSDDDSTVKGKQDEPQHVFFVSSTPKCPVCIERLDAATAATHDFSSEFVHRCNGTCLDLCTPQWAAFDAHEQSLSAAKGARSTALRNRRGFFDDLVDDIGEAFDDIVETVGGAFQDAIDDLNEAFVDLSEDVLETIGEQFNALSSGLQVNMGVHVRVSVRMCTHVCERACEQL